MGCDGKDFVVFFFFNFYYLRIVDIEVKDVFIFKDCRCVFMLEFFLLEGEFIKEKSRIILYLCCDFCVDRCDCGICDLIFIEKFFMVDIVEFSDFSLFDIEFYNYDEIDDNIDDFVFD